MWTFDCSCWSSSLRHCSSPGPNVKFLQNWFFPVLERISSNALQRHPFASWHQQNNANVQALQWLEWLEMTWNTPVLRLWTWGLDVHVPHRSKPQLLTWMLYCPSGPSLVTSHGIFWLLTAPKEFSKIVTPLSMLVPSMITMPSSVSTIPLRKNFMLFPLPANCSWEIYIYIFFFVASFGRNLFSQTVFRPTMTTSSTCIRM